MKKTGKIALGGVLGALSLICMLLTVFPSMTYARPGLAGLVLLPLALEAGPRWGWASFAVVAVLSFLFAPMPEAKMMFAAFFGYYPVARLWIEKRPFWLRWTVKLVLFNAAMILSYLLLLSVFHLDPDTFEIGGVNLPWLFLLAGNGVFIVYDVAIGRIVALYQARLHKIFARVFHI